MPDEKVLTPEEEEWANWTQHPCTKKLRRWALEGKQDLMEKWAAGEFSGAFTTELIVKNAGATGACSIYDAVIELDYNQIGASDEEPLGPDSSGPSSTS